MTSSARQRARRAFQRLSLSEAQAERVRQHLHDDRRQWVAAQQLLTECRRQLGEALAAPTPDSAAVLELAVQERVLEERARALSVHLEERMAGLLRPDQAVRHRALGPAVFGDVLGRLCA
jgi:Spy/CpxP family protein refolding chaperone